MHHIERETEYSLMIEVCSPLLTARLGSKPMRATKFLAAAILAKDSALIESLLGDNKVYCALMPGKQDEEEEEREGDDEAPSREESGIPSQDLLLRVTLAR